MNIKSKLEKWIKETLDVESGFVLDAPVNLEHPTELAHGDYSTNVALVLKKNAKELVEKLEARKLEEIEKIEIAGPGFINFFLKKEFFSAQVKEINESGEDYGQSDLLKGEKIFFEHTQPNPFKEFHIGHMMNNTIGESVSRVLRESGVELKVCSYHGDVGLHVAKAIWGILEQPDSVADAYARGHKAYEDDEDAKKEIIEISKKIYDRSDDKINSLYENGKKNSLNHFEELYKKLDSHFHFHFYESEAGEIGKKLVLENVGKVFEGGEKGAVIFRGENFEPKTHTRVFLNSEGLPTYEAKEVGLAEIKKEKFSYNKSITVTANEQDAFFNVVEVAIGEVFPELKGKLKHLSHGILKLPSGKMSSRTGTIISAESLIDQVKTKVFDKLQDRDLSTEEKENVAEIVAIGAIKYSILRQAVGGDIIFDFEKSISFEGDSGPYLQYAYVRARSVLEKANYNTPKMSKMPFDMPTTNLEKYLYRFPEIVERVAKEYSPHYLVTYLTELAGLFNSFYAKEKIIDEGDPTSPYKISLTSATAHVLKNGLNLLGIKVPERM
jgi:arginyl-tRNA synthetase